MNIISQIVNETNYRRNNQSNKLILLLQEMLRNTLILFEITVNQQNKFQILSGQNENYNLKYVTKLIPQFYKLIITILMETIAPKCINNKVCANICNVKTCKAIPFLCNDQKCQCYSKHQQCTTNIRWKSMNSLFVNKLKKQSSQLDKYFAQVNDLYKSVIKQIDKSFQQIKNIVDNFGLSQLEREVYQKLKQRKFSELTGEMINKVEIDLMTGKIQFQIRIIDKEKNQIQKQTTILIQMLEGLTNLNVVKEIKSNSPRKQSISSKLDSKITLDFETLSSFFSKKIVSMNLLYRASENNFQVSKFHEKCDGKPHTITILKTEFGNVIGGYTPLPWDKNKQSIRSGWQSDNSMQSFIFSLTNKHKLTLIEKQKKYAIFHSSSLGPIFGAGHDIAIQDKADENTNSRARPSNTYNYNNEYGFNQQSYKKWSGQSNGQYFQILQWQVHSIVFG